MAKTYWVNNDGLRVGFGSQAQPEPQPAAGGRFGVAKKTIVVDFKYDSLPTRTSGNAADAFIPSGSIITEAWVLVDQAFAGANLTVGLVRSDGTTAIDADGIMTATQGADGSLTAGLIAKCDGAYVPYRYTDTQAGSATDALLPVPVQLGYDGYIEAYSSGTMTAGSARIVIEYIEPYTAVVV